MKRLLTRSQMWDRMMAAGRKGVASELEMAIRYTRAFPEYANGWMVLAGVLGQTARYADAKVALRRAARLLPPDARSYIATGWAQLYEGKGDQRTAERWHRRAIALRPNTTNHIFLGAALARQGRFAEAKQHYRRALSRAKDLATDASDEAHYNIALVLRAERRYDEASMHLKAAISICPTYAIAKEALRDVEEAIRIRKAG